MSLKEIHEQQRSPIERLQDLNKQSRVELENSLLKEALALSSEQCEKSLKECAGLLQTAERNWRNEQQRSNARYEKELAELNAEVERILSSNEILQEAISGRIGALTDKVGKETVQEVSRALQGQSDAIQKKTEAFEQQTDRLEKIMESQAKRVERSQERFFAFNTWQTRIFWLGWVCNIFTLLLLIFVVLTK